MGLRAVHAYHRMTCRCDSPLLLSSHENCFNSLIVNDSFRFELLKLVCAFAFDVFGNK